MKRRIKKEGWWHEDLSTGKHGNKAWDIHYLDGVVDGSVRWWNSDGSIDIQTQCLVGFEHGVYLNFEYWVD